MFDIPVTSPIFYFLILPILVLLARYIVQRSTFYSALAEPAHDTFEPERIVNERFKNRHEMLDGLRGFLALGVLFQHAMTNFTYFNTGIWEITPIKFYRFAGGEAVILFFLITSFLYWSKAIRSKGNISAVTIYRNRFWRLAPMYLFSAGLVTLSVLVQTQFELHSVIGFFKDILSWLSLGLVTTTSMNTVSIIPINAGIHWTLHYEWIFYLLLPVTAFALRGGLYSLLYVPLVASIFLTKDWGYWIIFLFGMGLAHIVHKWPRAGWFKTNWFASVLPILLIFLVYIYQFKPYSVPQYALSSLALLCFKIGRAHV